jgi:hypothetical protein
MSKQRPLLAARTRAAARFSWFWRMDPQIERTYGNADWAVRRYANQVADAERWGDEIGLHTHAWRWDAALNRWIADHDNRTWIEQCLKTSFAAYESAFGRTCRIFRFGDGWIDEAMLGLIEQLGARIDLTVEPGLSGTPSLVPEEASTGFIPDRRNVPLQPYHPSPTDFRRPGRDSAAKLWMFPVSTGLASRQAQRQHALLNLWARFTAPRPPKIQLNLGIHPDQFQPIFDYAVSQCKHPYAAICVRTDVGANDGLMGCVEHNLHNILDHRHADRFVFATPSEALAMLVDEHSSRGQGSTAVIS